MKIQGITYKTDVQWARIYVQILQGRFTFE